MLQVQSEKVLSSLQDLKLVEAKHNEENRQLISSLLNMAEVEKLCSCVVVFLLAMLSSTRSMELAITYKYLDSKYSRCTKSSFIM